MGEVASDTRRTAQGVKLPFFDLPLPTHDNKTQQILF